MEQKALIKMFKTPIGYYFFDANRNQIVNVTKEQYISLENCFDPNKNDIDVDDQNVFDKYKSLGYFSNGIEKVVDQRIDYIDDILNSCLRKVTLQLTQQCNFRCSYCIYSDLNNSSNRSHTGKRMSLNTAKKCIDFLLEHSSCNDKVVCQQ